MVVLIYKTKGWGASDMETNLRCHLLMNLESLDPLWTFVKMAPSRRRGCIAWMKMRTLMTLSLTRLEGRD